MTEKNTVLRPWEKAVEHSFVLKVANNSSMTFAMPLDGDVEVAGDTIFGAGACCTLIEFKRDIEAVGDEVEKFGSRRRTGNKKTDKELCVKSYAYACGQLTGRDKHHYVVYGEWNSSAGTPVFELKGHNYFSEKKIEGAIEAIVSLDVGWAELELADYLEDFVRIKFYGNYSESESGEKQTNQRVCDSIVDDESQSNSDFDSTFIVAVSPVGRFMIPFCIIYPRLLKMVARMKLKI